MITNPVNGDDDGIRFFGDTIKILRNTISGTSTRYGHADCMQTYATNTPGSNNVLIEGNRRERIDNMCLMAEGPNEGEGSAFVAQGQPSVAGEPGEGALDAPAMTAQCGGPV